MKSAEELTAYLNTKFADDSIELHTPTSGTQWISVPAVSIKNIAKFLRDDPECAFDVLMCLSGLHYKSEEELGVTYHINSTSLGHSLAMKVRVPEGDPHIPSVESIWKTANWHEREAFDMVGVVFDEHPNLQRILCPTDWEGHPLRKDYVAQEFYQDMTTGE